MDTRRPRILSRFKSAQFVSTADLRLWDSDVRVNTRARPPKYNQFAYTPPGAVTRLIGCTPVAAAMFLASLQKLQIGSFYEYDPMYACYHNDFLSSQKIDRHCPDVVNQMIELHHSFGTRPEGAPALSKGPVLSDEIFSGMTSQSSVTTPLNRLLRGKFANKYISLGLVEHGEAIQNVFFNRLDLPQVCMLHFSGIVSGQEIESTETYDSGQGNDIVHHSVLCYGFDRSKWRAAVSLGWGNTHEDIWLDLQGLSYAVHLFDVREPPEPIEW